MAEEEEEDEGVAAWGCMSGHRKRSMILPPKNTEFARARALLDRSQQRSWSEFTFGARGGGGYRHEEWRCLAPPRRRRKEESSKEITSL